MNDHEVVSLKEFVIAVMEERTRSIEVRLDAMDKAIELSCADMERRLETLNNLRNEVMMDRSQYVRRDLWETYVSERAQWREHVNKQVTTLETRSITWTAAIGIIFVVLNIVLRMVGH